MSEGDRSSSMDQDFVDPEEYYRGLPEPIKRRVRALKKLQLETVKIDAAFYKELLDLEVKYDAQHRAIFRQRETIVSGEKEPNEEECDWPSDTEDDVEKLCNEVSKSAVVADKDTNGSTVKGIPDFWLQALKNVPMINDMIQQRDIPILAHLIDIKSQLHTEEPGFTLEFHFSQNKYFTNSVLTKRYFFSYDISPDEPFSYEGPEITSTKGCFITWNPGENVTVKVIKKVQKKKTGGAKRSVTKTVPDDSFFNFFEPPAETITDEIDDDTQALLETDFKIGQFIRESLIPRAVLFFTGEEVGDDSEFGDEDDADEDDEDDEDDKDDEESDEDEAGHRQQRGRHHRGGPGHGKKTGAAGEQPECKQQ